MKLFFSFLTDSVYVVFFFLIILAAFMATYALSPIKFEDSILGKTNQPMGVLGDVDVHRIEYVELYEEHNYFSIDSNIVGNNYYADFKIGPYTAGELEKPIVNIKNTSAAGANVKVSLKAAISAVEGLQMGLRVGDEKVSMQKGVFEREIFLTGNTEKEVSFYTNTSSDINYPLSLYLEITQL